jgi:hypothetical protein
MNTWRLTEEPSLDDLLDDEIMKPVLRSAGLNRAELHRQLDEIARRLAGSPRREELLCCSA